MSAKDDLAVAYVKADGEMRDYDRRRFRLSQATLVMGRFTARVAQLGERPFLQDDIIVDEEVEPGHFRRRIVAAQIVDRVRPGALLPQAVALEMALRIGRRQG